MSNAIVPIDPQFEFKSTLNFDTLAEIRGNTGDLETSDHWMLYTRGKCRKADAGYECCIAGKFHGNKCCAFDGGGCFE